MSHLDADDEVPDRPLLLQSVVASSLAALADS